MKKLLFFLFLLSQIPNCFSQTNADTLQQLNELKFLRSSLINKSLQLQAALDTSQVLIDSCTIKFNVLKKELATRNNTSKKEKERIDREDKKLSQLNIQLGEIIERHAQYEKDLARANSLISQVNDSIKSLTGTILTRPNISKERSDSLGRHIPKALGWTSDFADIFTSDEVKALDSLISNFEKKTTVQISVATVNTTMVIDQDFEDYSLTMMRNWGVGTKEKNNGILIVISPALRRIRIQNGYGIEDALSDSDTKSIIENFFIPRFKEGKYFEGTREGIIAIIDKLKQQGF